MALAGGRGHRHRGSLTPWRKRVRAMIKAANPMTASGATQEPAAPQPVTPIPARWVARLLATAARAPSVHNTQPWRFGVTPHAIELYADPGRKGPQDAIGRELLSHGGGAQFGVRVGGRGHPPAP